MLEININLLPGGNELGRRCIQSIGIWNVSDLADVSDYEYAISEPVPMTDRRGIAADARDVALGDAPAVKRGYIAGHRRDQDVMVLVHKVLADSMVSKDGE